MKVYQIIGYKKSGKTTTICNLLDKLKQKNIAVLKHHGHNNIIAAANEILPDSHRFIEHGAVASILLTTEPRQLEVLGQLDLKLDIKKIRRASESEGVDLIISILKKHKLDYIFIEGFKSLDYPKIALAIDENSYPHANNIILRLHGQDRQAQTIIDKLNL